MATYVNTFFEKRLEDLLSLAHLVEEIFSSANLDYRIIGGLAAYIYVEEAEPDAGRLTRDIDVVVRRADLERISEAAKQYGLEYRHVAGVDMLARADQPSGRRAVRLVFSGPEIGPASSLRGLKLVPVEDLIRMKLTSFRIKDQAHLKDLDEARVITPQVEANLPPALRERLQSVRDKD